MAKARKKRSSSGSKRAARCKTVSIKGQGRRQLCWNSKGKIVSNKKA